MPNSNISMSISYSAGGPPQTAPGASPLALMKQIRPEARSPKRISLSRIYRVALLPHQQPPEIVRSVPVRPLMVQDGHKNHSRQKTENAEPGIQGQEIEIQLYRSQTCSSYQHIPQSQYG